MADALEREAQERAEGEEGREEEKSCGKEVRPGAVGGKVRDRSP